MNPYTEKTLKKLDSEVFRIVPVTPQNKIIIEDFLRLAIQGAYDAGAIAQVVDNNSGVDEAQVEARGFELGKRSAYSDIGEKVNKMYRRPITGEWDDGYSNALSDVKYLLINTCCENGNFGENHECLKSENKK